MPALPNEVYSRAATMHSQCPTALNHSGGIAEDRYETQSSRPPVDTSTSSMLGSPDLSSPASRAQPARPGTQGPRLPQELFDVVLDFLWSDDRDVLQCMLVSRAWHMYVVWRGLLAGTLRLTTASALASLVASPPASIARLRDVHTAYLIDAPPGAAPWLHRAPLQLGAALRCATVLHLRKWRPARAALHPLVFPAFAQFRAVARLHVKDCAFAGAPQLQGLLGGLPQLRMLGLWGVYVPKGRGGARLCRPPPRLERLWLGNSLKDRPGEDEENVAGCLAEWFAGDGKRLDALRVLHLRITHDVLREGELASLGRLVEVIGPRAEELELDFIDPPLDPAADWHQLKLDRCTRVQVLEVYRSTPALHELALLSPDCRIGALRLRRWTFPYKQRTDWDAVATALEGGAFAKLQKVVNARMTQSPEESVALEAFVRRMDARGVEFEDRTESPFWDH